MKLTSFPTTEAFKKVLNQPDLWRRTGRPMRARYKMKSLFQSGQTISPKPE